MISFLGERSEDFSHKDTSDLFRFYPVRDIPLHFISLYVVSRIPIGRIYPIFPETLRRVRDLFYSKFRTPRIFFGEFLAIKFSIFTFFTGQMVFFGPAFPVSFEMLIILQ